MSLKKKVALGFVIAHYPLIANVLYTDKKNTNNKGGRGAAKAPVSASQVQDRDEYRHAA